NGWPALHLDDVSGIPFLKDIVGVEQYQLRARVRARDQDVYITTCREIPAYQDYCTEMLGLGRPEHIQAPVVSIPIRIAEAAQSGAPFRQLVHIARQLGSMVIHPYMGIEPVWRLARRLNIVSGARVAVLAPPPPVTWYANNKINFTRCVEEVIGPEVLVDRRIANNAEDLTTGLLELAEAHPLVALKMGRCASAMGNKRFESDILKRQSRSQIVSEVEQFLREKEWIRGREVLAVAWASTDLSPSTQMWIPPIGGGEPFVDGVYEQILVGVERMFLGSIPAQFDAALQERIVELSLMVGRVYQELGYVGQCSFDFIIVDDKPLFVECNGRWGGTSTPMRFMDRLFPDHRPAYRARDHVSEKLKGLPFTAVLEMLGDTLYDARTGNGSYIIYNVGCQPEYGKLDVIAIGDDMTTATALLEEQLPELLGEPVHSPDNDL
ncbi:MAG: hypothetical protein HN348_30485, partial [Proteobacteria bacterium]|nr:hypothetical protein [Pseudomonadota bacterium]